MVLSLCAVSGAHGADAVADLRGGPVAAGPPGWALQVTPYLWAASLDGDISSFRRGPVIGVEKPFSAIIDDLNFGGFVNLWARKGRFVVSGDIMYVDTTGSHGRGPLPAITIPGLGTIPPGGDVRAEVDTRQFTATLLGGYRVLDGPGMTVDALGGVRIWHIANDVRLSGRLGGLGGSVRHDDSFGWLDPLVGLRVFVPLADGLSLQGQADIGGFGAGSDFTWSALASLNYVINDRLSASVGYKVLAVDYDHDGHVFDARLGGPVLGMTYRF